MASWRKDMEWWQVILVGLAGQVVVFLGLWLWQTRTRDASVVDVGWALSLGGLAVWYAVALEGDPARRLLVALATGLWAARLGLFLGRRIAHAGGEDGRYAAMRRHWGERANVGFLWFFQAQGVANILLGATLMPLLMSPGGVGPWDILGLAVIAGAILGEGVADAQLERFRRNPANRGQVCREGLWAWSRHPNYFFEWCHWLGYPVMGLGLWGTGLAAWYPLTWLGAVVMLGLLLRGTGIPYAEQQALRSRGDAYRRYQREVSAFVPLPPRAREGSEA